MTLNLPSIVSWYLVKTHIHRGVHESSFWVMHWIWSWIKKNGVKRLLDMRMALVMCSGWCAYHVSFILYTFLPENKKQMIGYPWAVTRDQVLRVAGNRISHTWGVSCAVFVCSICVYWIKRQYNILYIEILSNYMTWVLVVLQKSPFNQEWLHAQFQQMYRWIFLLTKSSING